MSNLEKFWKGKKVFITGHTGFKGSWLLLTLQELGAVIAGYSLPPAKGGIFEILKLQKKIENNYYRNILDYKFLNNSIRKFKPDIIFHLAAQPLVLESYKNPFYNFEVNSMGTLNLLEIIRNLNYKGSAIIVTTDKVYKSKKKFVNFKETDEIGVTDPYGSSKVLSEIIAQSYAKSFLNNGVKFNISVARSGNVIGGGDFSKDRIIPDFYKSLKLKKKLKIRNPSHVRPWQHVLEPIYGYLLLAQFFYSGKNNKEVCWNFGPKQKDSISVLKLIKKLNKISKKKVNIFLAKNTNLKSKETKTLTLNSNKAKKYLKWKQKMNIDKALSNIVSWHETNNSNKLKVTIAQIKEYLNLLI